MSAPRYDPRIPMRRELIVVDDFYPDPRRVRALALTRRYTIQGGNQHFERTASYFPADIIETFGKLVGAPLRIDAGWTKPRTEDGKNLDTFNGTFYRVAPNTQPPTHIHHDAQDWIGIVYLSPDCPSTEGTAFYQHKETGATSAADPAHPEGDLITRRDGRDLSKWTCTEFVGHRFNRLLLYRGRRYHRALIHSGPQRLCQVFAFDIDRS